MHFVKAILRTLSAVISLPTRLTPQSIRQCCTEIGTAACHTGSFKVGNAWPAAYDALGATLDAYEMKQHP